MQIDGATILWVFGITIGVIGSLAALLYKRHEKEIDEVKTRATAVDIETKKTIARMFDKMDVDRDQRDQRDQKIMDRLDELKEQMSNYAINSGERRSDCIRTFVSKEECNRRHAG